MNDLIDPEVGGERHKRKLKYGQVRCIKGARSPSHQQPEPKPSHQPPAGKDAARCREKVTKKVEASEPGDFHHLGVGAGGIRSWVLGAKTVGKEEACQLSVLDNCHSDHSAELAGTRGKALLEGMGQR